MYNHTGLQGRLTADPELRYTQQGTAITSFTLASDTGRKTKDGKKITNFIECVAWRAQAEFVCKYLSKGRLVLVEGELTSRSYEDKDGNRRKAVEITVDSVHFCDSKKDGGQSSGSDFADPGYAKIITFILQSEPGTSLRAAGWTLEAAKAGKPRWNKERYAAKPVQLPLFPSKQPPAEYKQRWAKALSQKEDTTT